MGVEQTELDALVALHPGLLDQIARRALDHFYDHTLAARVEEYRREWLGRAWQMLEPRLDAGGSMTSIVTPRSAWSRCASRSPS